MTRTLRFSAMPPRSLPRAQQQQMRPILKDPSLPVVLVWALVAELEALPSPVSA